MTVILFHMERRLFLTWQVFLILLATLLAALGCFRPALVQFLFIHTSYYILLLLFLFWALTLLQFLRAEPPDRRALVRDYGPGLLVSLLLCLCIFLTNTPFLRVLTDEATLVSVSQTFAYDRKPLLTVTGINYGFAFRGLDFLIPQRPLLFPFFIHIFHVLTGYRVENAFALNFIVLFAFLSFLFVWFRKNIGWAQAYTILFFVASQPLVIENASSAGFDLFAALFLMLSLALAYHFMRAPSALTFQMLWIHLLLLAHIRYESPLFFILILVSLIGLGYVKKEYFRGSLLYAATPLLLLPIFWQRFLGKVPYSEIDAAPFSLAYFMDHTALFFQLLIGSKISPLGAACVNMLGLAGLVNFLYLFLKREWLSSKAARHAFVIALACLIALWCILASYYYGNLDRLSCTRYYVLFYMLLSVFAALLLSRFKLYEKFPAPMIVGAFLLYLSCHGLSLQKGITIDLDLPRFHRYAMSFLKQLPPHRNFLVISDRPVHYTIYNYGAIYFHTATKFQAKIADDYYHHLYQDIYVIQEIDRQTGQPKSHTKLEGNFTLTPVYAMQYASNEIMRISKAVPAPPSGVDEQA